ncbi:MAG: hypothetical protein ABJF67_13220 [Aurantimonas coralicida]|uniref:hypothetical protein n=1 Tax=Nisaea sp. TaxID=2024842 RepID=UPI0032662369
MELINKVQIATIPHWARVLIGLIILALAVVCGALFFVAMYEGDRSSWVQAAAHLTGVIAPILLFTLCIAAVQSGTLSIAKRTEHTLNSVIPSQLRLIPESAPDFKRWSRNFRSSQDDRTADVSISHIRGRCYADYEIKYQDDDGQEITCRIRVELNVHRVNFNLYIPCHEPVYLEACSEHELDATVLIDNHLRHTVGANKKHSDAGGLAAPIGCYVFRPDLLRRRLGTDEYVVLVASATLPSDLLWNPAERLYFAQDLMFMVRSIVNEAPYLFRNEKPSRSTGTPMRTELAASA